jgi:hypothetical protein
LSTDKISRRVYIPLEYPLFDGIFSLDEAWIGIDAASKLPAGLPRT